MTNANQPLDADAIYAARAWLRDYSESEEGQAALRALLQEKAGKTALPPSLPPEGLGRAQAAAFCGLSVKSFDAAVKDARLPQAIRFGRKDGRFIWTVTGLSAALEKLADLTARNSRQGGWADVGKNAMSGRKKRRRP